MTWSVLCVIICWACVLEQGMSVFEEMTWTCALPVFVCRCVMPEVSAKNQSVNSCVILLVYRWWSPKCLSCRYVPVLYLPVTVCMHGSLIWSVMLTSRSSAGAKDVKSAWQRMGSEEGKIMRTYICVVWLRRHENRNKEIKGGHETERETLLQLMMLKSSFLGGSLQAVLHMLTKELKYLSKLSSVFLSSRASALNWDQSKAFLSGSYTTPNDDTVR